MKLIISLVTLICLSLNAMSKDLKNYYKMLKYPPNHTINALTWLDSTHFIAQYTKISNGSWGLGNGHFLSADKTIFKLYTVNKKYSLIKCYSEFSIDLIEDCEEKTHLSQILTIKNNLITLSYQLDPFKVKLRLIDLKGNILDSYEEKLNLSQYILKEFDDMFILADEFGTILLFEINDNRINLLSKFSLNSHISGIINIKEKHLAVSTWYKLIILELNGQELKLKEKIESEYPLGELILKSKNYIISGFDRYLSIYNIYSSKWIFYDIGEFGNITDLSKLKDGTILFRSNYKIYFFYLNISNWISRYEILDIKQNNLKFILGYDQRNLITAYYSDHLNMSSHNSISYSLSPI